MKIGYIRVSTQEQNTIRQEVLMESLGVEEVYIDRKNLKYQLIGEERNPVLYRGVQIQATHLTAYIDQQSIEIFVNDGKEVLTSVFYIEGPKKVYSQI